MKMSDDRHLDGNAVGGLLLEIFGRDMTDQLGCCSNCGAVNPIAAVYVYADAPGVVVRCPACSTVLLVITDLESSYRVSFEGLKWIQPSKP
jgi:hypothetical protein